MSLESLINEILEGADVWDNRYLDLNVRAIYKNVRAEKAEELIEEFLSKENQFSFNSANPFSKKLLLSELLPDLLKGLVGKDDDPDHGLKFSCALVTLLRNEWNFPEGEITFDITRAKKIVRNALVGFDHIGRFEAVTYENQFIDIGGNQKPRVCFHCHCIVWTANSYSKLERLRKRIGGRFGGGGRYGAHFSRIKTPRELGASFRYMSKMQTLGKRVVKSTNGHSRQRSRVLKLRSYYEMFNEMRKNNMYTFWLSGGQGVQILRGARFRLQERAGKRRPFGAARNLRRIPKYRQD